MNNCHTLLTSPASRVGGGAVLPPPPPSKEDSDLQLFQHRSQDQKLKSILEKALFVTACWVHSVSGEPRGLQSS